MAALHSFPTFLTFTVSQAFAAFAPMPVTLTLP